MDKLNTNQKTKTVRANCGIFRRLMARVLDTLSCILFTLFFSILYLIGKNGDRWKEVFLTREGMFIIISMTLLFFLFWFVLIPFLNKGRTFYKYFFKIHLETDKYQMEIAIIIKELLVTIIPTLALYLIPASFSEQEFSQLFLNASVVENFNRSLNSLGFRIVTFFFSSIFLVSVITVFVSKRRASLLDLVAHTWVYLEEEVEIKPEEKPGSEAKEQLRPGLFELEDIKE